jgi:hypothetical protein
MSCPLLTTQRWRDPYDGLPELELSESIEESEAQDAQHEEDQRRLAAERLWRGQPTPLWQSAQEEERIATEAEVEQRLLAHKEQLARSRQEKLEAERKEREALRVAALALGASIGDTDDAALGSPAQSAKNIAASTEAGDQQEYILTVDVGLKRTRLDPEVLEVEVTEADDTLRERFRRELEDSKLAAQGRER